MKIWNASDLYGLGIVFFHTDLPNSLTFSHSDCMHIACTMMWVVKNLDTFHITLSIAGAWRHSNNHDESELSYFAYYQALKSSLVCCNAHLVTTCGCSHWKKKYCLMWTCDMLMANCHSIKELLFNIFILYSSPFHFLISCVAPKKLVQSYFTL